MGCGSCLNRRRLNGLKGQGGHVEFHEEFRSLLLVLQGSSPLGLDLLPHFRDLALP
jgi:hypothetical protein